MFGTISKIFTQAVFIPAPKFTPSDVPDQKGKVHIVTGGYTGIGLELVKVLYAKNATVYILGRNKDKATAAIDAVFKAFPGSEGRINFIPCDLADLTSIKPAAEEFLTKESRLDVLTNNAGVMVPPAELKSAQGHDLQMATNCLGHFALTILLLPVLQRTAAVSAPGSVRVTWGSSGAVDLSPMKGGFLWDEKTGAPNLKNRSMNYGMTKVGAVFLSVEMARRYGSGKDASAIVSAAWNPGNLASELWRNVPRLVYKILKLLYIHPVEMGRYALLFAGWSQHVGLENNGAWVIPWGRLAEVRSDIGRNLKRKDEGGTGQAERFWEWCEKETKDYV